MRSSSLTLSQARYKAISAVSVSELLKGWCGRGLLSVRMLSVNIIMVIDCMVGVNLKQSTEAPF